MNISSLVNSCVAALPTDMYTGRANLILHIKTKSGQTFIDEVGNVMPIETLTVVEAIAKTKDMAIAEKEVVGPDVNGIPLMCRAISPKILPNGMNFDDRVPATYTDAGTGNSLTGEFFFTSPKLSVVAGALNALGQQFEGVFQEVAS